MRMAAPANEDEIRQVLQAAVRKWGTQKDLARHLGFSEKHVSLMLTGKASISLGTLFGILDYTGLKLVITDRIVTTKGLQGQYSDL